MTHKFFFFFLVFGPKACAKRGFNAKQASNELVLGFKKKKKPYALSQTYASLPVVCCKANMRISQKKSTVQQILSQN